MVFVSQTCGPVLAQLPPNVEVIAADADQAPGSIRINNLGDSSEPQQTPDLRALLDEVDLDLSKSPLSTQEQDMAIAISERVKATEWLGALGPVAVSPFFGLTCLSAIAIVGEDRLPEDHYLRRASTPLRHPLVFIVFLLLTILTSIPKFSKVSKPFAQAMDQLETYSAIVILLVIRVMGGIEMGPEESQVAVVYQAGFIEVTAEGMLMLATIVNIIVINTVKFFFEILIWITPIPFVDALFEVANKVACASLAAIYAFSPAIATIINLAILACCLLAFAWIKRREVFYRSILIEFVMHWWRPNANLPPDGKLIVFPKDKVGDIPAMSRCEFSKTQDGWAVRMPRMLRPAIDYAWTTGKPAIQSGLLKNQLTMDQFEFQFGKRHNQQLQALADTLGASCNETATQQTPFGNLSAEMA